MQRPSAINVFSKFVVRGIIFSLTYHVSKHLSFMSYFQMQMQHVLLTNEFGAKWAQLPSVLENSLAE